MKPSGKKVGIVVAMDEEAKPLIEGLKLDLQETKDGDIIYSSPDIVLVVAGIGSLNACIATVNLALIQNCDIIYNIGTCGATGTVFSPSEILSVKNVYKRDVDLTLAGFKKYQFPGMEECLSLIPDPAFKQCDCYSSDEFVGIDTPVPKNVIVEMEAYSVAFVCYKYKIPCKIYKVVSDFTDTNKDDSEFQSNLEKASKILADYIINVIKEEI